MRGRTTAIAATAPSEASGQATPQPVLIANGTLEALKWLGLVLMTVDHVNKYLLAHTLPFAFQAGRLAMPIFVFVLAYNLARPGAVAAGAHLRTCKRLLVFGLVACVPYMSFGTVLGGWWPLNILFMLLVATAIIGLIDHGGRLQGGFAVALFAVGGSVVEYWWPGLVLALACWNYCKVPTLARLAWLVVATAALAVVNQNFWAIAALPLLLVAPYVEIPTPRMRHIFYVYYPAHLAVLWLVGSWMA
jgi:hypothetical protein